MDLPVGMDLLYVRCCFMGSKIPDLCHVPRNKLFVLDPTASCYLERVAIIYFPKFSLKRKGLKTHYQSKSDSDRITKKYI